MAKALVIVESPAKAKTINKYLGKQYLVKASLGHIKDLPKKDLAVDVEHGFEPTYVVIEGKKKLISELKQAAKKVESVYLAADPDREGEAICYHLQEELGGDHGKNGKGSKHSKKSGPQFFRVMFNEITARGIKKAFEEPGQVDLHRVEAQQARRVLDRLVGYKISPLLWDKVKRGLSAGRVQTVALRFIVEREREIRAFNKQEYWSIDAALAAKNPPTFDAQFSGKNGEKYDKMQLGDEAAAKAITSALENADWRATNVERREQQRRPVPPFTTSKFQQDASRKLGLPVKVAMGIAQKLYMGVELGDEGSVGLITYMRTDSTRVGKEALDEVRAHIGKEYGKDFLP